ncbi:MAG TPA: hypothetical protein VL093_12855 [Flavipsychrobacter sp.]|jgi:hypothetical protein|nr:hypothetical protein [Flavipsychrobacter sp.]
MANSRDSSQRNSNREEEQPQNLPGGPQLNSSLDDSASDIERLKQDTSYINLPEVNDIPGQENITNVAPLGELADTTASSDDEEGVEEGQDVLDPDNDDVTIVMGTEADVTKEDLELLGDPNEDFDMNDDEQIDMEGLDDTDSDGDLLNEGIADTDSTGDELDIPGADGSDPRQDAMGQGDEENNYYSLGSDNNDNVTEGTP